MDKLLSDSAKIEILNKVMDILRAYHISNWHSEPYHQNQNPAEWIYRTIMSWTNMIMKVWCTCKLLVTIHDLCVLYPQSHHMFRIGWINPISGSIWYTNNVAIHILPTRLLCNI